MSDARNRLNSALSGRYRIERELGAGDFQRSTPAPARELNIVVGWDAVVRAKSKQ